MPNDTPSREDRTIPQGLGPQFSTPDLSRTAESGWAAVAKTIHEIDRTKVADVKEDIDNILVFAGLYSAVLSALIAISIAPQSDSSGAVTPLLTRLLSQMQSYTITSRFINTTATAPASTTLAVSSSGLSLTAKRVNVLWVASLTLALITASFGILVKQWLREYLAVEHVSPQARLRIRHFRKPGLEGWHVYGIASLLPLIIQVALALFFVGLCFFTLDINTSIGYTAIPLVAIWALLFLFTAFAPSISSRCPYKIPLMKPFRNIFHKSPAGAAPHPPGVRSIKITALPFHAAESDVVDIKVHDAEILMEIAETQGDDDLLAKICRAAKETLSPQERFGLLLDILRSRLPYREDDYHLTDERFRVDLELTEIPPRTCTILLDSFADILLEEVKGFPSSQIIEWVPHGWKSLGLLLARLPCPLSEHATDVVALCFSATNYLRVYSIFERMFKNPQDPSL
ncbi:hypothetical protein BDW22DRAFT_824759 [Trametopsis cervina]|nr:hypothetical protein BDW22DRAFT_824759 [Trametopsis cervina]